MGIKQFFGKSLLSLIRDADRDEKAIETTRVNKLHDMFNGCIPAMVAFKIDNGYVVRAMDAEQAYVGGRVGGFTFCKDHQAIAEHIVGAEAKRKLLGDQQEMFQERAMKAQAVAAQAPMTNIGRRI